jgi:propanediol utilization protein
MSRTLTLAVLALALLALSLGQSQSVEASYQAMLAPRQAAVGLTGKALTPPATCQSAAIAPEDRMVVFRGTITVLPQDVLTGTWQVGNRTVLVEQSTRIQGDPAVGRTALVQGRLNQDGSIRARHIKIMADRDRPKPVLIRGTIEAYSADSITVNGVTAAISDTTVIRGTPVVGQRAHVQAQVQDDGSFLARRIVVLGQGDDDENEVEFKGPIVSISDTTWVVGAVTVTLNVSTTIEGTPAVGAIAEVRGTRQPDGTVLASHIEIEADDDEDDRVAFKGTILTLPAERLGQWTIRTRQGDVTITVDPSTTLDESRGALAEGANVQVNATRQPDNTLLAWRVRVTR